VEAQQAQLLRLEFLDELRLGGGNTLDCALADARERLNSLGARLDVLCTELNWSLPAVAFNRRFDQLRWKVDPLTARFTFDFGRSNEGEQARTLDCRTNARAAEWHLCDARNTVVSSPRAS
jgi:hypothetical protein